jgi:predicted alpha/beta hydrolase family esterase
MMATTSREFTHEAFGPWAPTTDNQLKLISMKTAIILHGKPSEEEYLNPENPSASHNNWLPWVQRRLILNGVLTQTPEMPTPHAPTYHAWCSIFNQLDIDQDTMLIGHSLGAGFLVRWLSENRIQTGRVVLVAPWLDPNHTLTPAFFDSPFDENVVSRTQGMHIFVSDDDDPTILTSCDILKNAIQGIQIREFHGYGHFIFGHMGTNEFPELRDFLLGQ